MNEASPNSSSFSTDNFLKRYGEPEDVFKPSPWQTVVGVGISVCFSFVGFVVAIFGDTRSGLKWFGVLVGVVGIGFAYYIYQLRKWRLVICAEGLVQIRAWEIDEIAWSDVFEVVEHRYEGGKSPLFLTIKAQTKVVAVKPLNFRNTKLLYETLLAVAKRKNIPIRIFYLPHPD